MRRKIDKLTINPGTELQRWATQLNPSSLQTDKKSRKTLVEYFIKQRGAKVTRTSGMMNRFPKHLLSHESNHPYFTKGMSPPPLSDLLKSDLKAQRDLSRRKLIIEKPLTTQVQHIIEEEERGENSSNGRDSWSSYTSSEDSGQASSSSICIERNDFQELAFQPLLQFDCTPTEDISAIYCCHSTTVECKFSAPYQDPSSDGTRFCGLSELSPDSGESIYL